MTDEEWPDTLDEDGEWDDTVYSEEEIAELEQAMARAALKTGETLKRFAEACKNAAAHFGRMSDDAVLRSDTIDG